MRAFTPSATWTPVCSAAGMVDRSDVRRGEGWRLPPPTRVRGEFFSLGGLLAPYVKARTPFAPWTLSAAFLLTLGVWDPLMRGGPFDSILLGLAAYELLIGLTRVETPQPARATQRVRRD